MVNPSFPKNQMVGVFNLELLRLYGYLYQEGNKNYTILHALVIQKTNVQTLLENGKIGFNMHGELSHSSVTPLTPLFEWS